MNWQRAMAAVAGGAAGLGVAAQGDPRPLEFERVEIQPAPELIDLGLSPFFQFVDSDASVVGSFRDDSGDNVTFRQQADGTGFVPLADLVDDPVELTFFRDWDPTGTYLLGFEVENQTGRTLVYTRIPAPGVPVILSVAALLANRRRR